jgi:hypothetical protein
MHLEAGIERVWRCTGRPWPSGIGDALGGRDRVELRGAPGGCDQDSLEMQFEPMIEQLRDALGGHDHVELRDAVGGRDQVILEIHLEDKIV